ncbi:MAG: ATP-binding protein, partial [Waddliaceae bacterium]
LSFTQQEKFYDDLTIIVIKVGYYDRPDLAQSVSTQFRSDLSQLQAIRDLVKRFCRKAPGNSERLASEMELAIDEAFCNIVQHGHLENGKKPIKIKMELREEGVLIQLSDQGLPFDPAEVNEPSFSGNQDTGYGWHIIKELADIVSYTRRQTLQGWNNLCFYKRYYFGGN